jgi:hypothetical protein
MPATSAPPDPRRAPRQRGGRPGLAARHPAIRCHAGTPRPTQRRPTVATCRGHGAGSRPANGTIQSHRPSPHSRPDGEVAGRSFGLSPPLSSDARSAGTTSRQDPTRRKNTRPLSRHIRASDRRERASAGPSVDAVAEPQDAARTRAGTRSMTPALPLQARNASTRPTTVEVLLVQTSSRRPAARTALGAFRSACVTSHACDTRRRRWSGRGAPLSPDCCLDAKEKAVAAGGAHGRL